MHTAGKMSYVRVITAVFVACTFSSCKTTNEKIDYLLTERDLVPEGLAVDTRSGIVYISSTYKRKIIQLMPDGKVVDFIPAMFQNIESVVGMEIDEDRNLLWANTAHANEVMPLINPVIEREWKTEVWAFDIASKGVNKKYQLKASKAFLNDLTVLPNGDVYVTETVGAGIYKISPEEDSLELFLQLTGFSFPNGITYSPNTHTLFVSANEGIIAIDVISKRFHMLPVADSSIDARTVDGLTYHRGSLIGHQSSKVSLFTMNTLENEITSATILDEGDEFDSSTTGEVVSNAYYYIVNSQIRSAIDTTTGRLKPLDSLEDIIIRKHNL